jgi:dissimilatory sulfite reductase alpha subunit
VDLCPTHSMKWNAETKQLTIEDAECNRCMHCINLMPKALRPGQEKGATILVGGKAPIVHGALMSWVVVPFMKMEPPYDEFKEFVRKAWEWWDENGKMRERLGELINRLGMRAFLKAMDLPPVPQMIRAPAREPILLLGSRGGEIMSRTDFGPPNYKDLLPPVIKKNYGQWKYHDRVKPGV